jgi:hypothetical protein
MLSWEALKTEYACMLIFAIYANFVSFILVVLEFQNEN